MAAITGRATGERGNRRCATCMWWSEFPKTRTRYDDWRAEYEDMFDEREEKFGSCNLPGRQGWIVRTEGHWCDGWAPDMSKL